MKKFFITVIIIYFSLFTIQCFAQKQRQKLIDSLQTALQNYDAASTQLNKSVNNITDTNKVYILKDLSWELMMTGDHQKAKQYANDALILSQKINFKKGTGKVYNIIAGIHYFEGNYSDALKNLNASLKINQEIGNKKGIADSYDNIGNIYKKQGNYANALKNHFSSLKIYEDVGDKKGIAGSYNNIGSVYYQQGNFTDALKNHIASLKIRKETGDEAGMAASYINIGNIYSKEGNFLDALKNDSAALKIYAEIGDKNGIAGCLNNIGLLYIHQDNYPEALKHFSASLKINKEIGDKVGIATSYNNIGELDIRLKKFIESKKYLNDALSLSKEIGSKDLIKASYSSLALLDSATGNWKDAYLHHKLYIIYRDSLINEENTKISVQTQMQYEFDKKEIATKAEQDKKDAVTLKEAQRERLLRNSLGGGFAIVFLFAGVFFTQRNKIKKGKERSDELLLNILPEEVADELKATGATTAKDFQEVTVLFTDFKNFTTMSEKLSAQELVNEINYCYSAFDNIITKHGIEKIKTIGDSYMCAGGLPVANKTNAEDTVNAAIEIRDFMLNEKQKREAQGQTYFEIRIGCNTGSVVAGIVGIKKFAYDIWGDTVNIASRMESSGEAGKINISGSTFELVKNKFTCEHRGKIEAKNKGMIDMYFVERI